MEPDSAERPGVLYENVSGEYKEVRGSDIPEITVPEPEHRRFDTYYVCLHGERIAKCTLDTEKSKEYGGRVDVITASSPFYAFMVAEFFKKRGCTLNRNVPPPKHARCKNKKRFLKLLMGTGMSRRQAQWEAEFTQASMALLNRSGYHFTYQTSWINQHISRMDLEYPDLKTDAGCHCRGPPVISPPFK